MRTKTLVLTAAISAAALATSMAQGVFSVNAVGYVKLTIGSNNLALIANPLNQPNNDLNIILPLKDDTTQDGVSIYRFNPATGAYRSTISWISIGVGMGGVWFTPDSGTDPNATVLNPGEGVFFYNNTASSVDLTFVGEVMQGNLSSPIPANGALSIRSSQVPQSAALGDPSHADSLGFPAANGDLVYVFDVTAQTYKDTYTYIVDNTVVPPVAIWFSPSDLNPEGPVIPVGGSFFVIKADAAASVNWTRTFSVN